MEKLRKNVLIDFRVLFLSFDDDEIEIDRVVWKIHRIYRASEEFCALLA